MTKEPSQVEQEFALRTIPPFAGTRGFIKRGRKILRLSYAPPCSDPDHTEAPASFVTPASRQFIFVFFARFSAIPRRIRRLREGLRAIPAAFGEMVLAFGEAVARLSPTDDVPISRPDPKRGKPYLISEPLREINASRGSNERSLFWLRLCRVHPGESVKPPAFYLLFQSKIPYNPNRRQESRRTR